MAPSPQEQLREEVPMKMRPAPGEEVVISGLSGIFPMSDSVEAFSNNLYNKVDMVSADDPRWVYEHPEMPKHFGKVSGISQFDAQFFRVHHKQAATMEPMSMKLLEHAYSAIYDSGINPLQLRGKKVGVFIGATHSESEKKVIFENVQRNGFGITGCNKAMYANRISYWIDGKGPSYALDLSCSSSMACIEHAYRSISTGQCDAAIVGGSNLCMHPSVCLNFQRAGFLNLDGKTKCFDKNGDGHVRSDSISVLFLQKAKDAKRIYSEVYYAKCGFSTSSKLLSPVREPKELSQFLETFYAEIGVSPADVEYVEANGAAFVEADTNELMAIGSVFGKEHPISVGCVKSNMGSSEPASGVCAATKVCIAFQHGKMPGNLHYKDPIDIPEVKDGRINVLTDTADFNRGFAALNSLSYGGSTVHVLLKGHYKEKDATRYKSSIPYLVILSGRKADCITELMDTLKQKPLDPEEIGLLHNIHQYDIPGHMTRGYTILDKNSENKTVCLSQSVEYCPGTSRPLWFVYSGMGSQWATMGAELMRVPVFAAAIQKCHKVLEPKGIDIVRILTEPDKKIYDNILYSFVGIAAVQIGLTDILTQMGVVPDNIIGHSVGELGCAYADGCFTAEEMILSAYSRGLVSIQTPFIRGSMAAVGLGYKAVLPLCPPGIEVACHNSADSATISGPVDIMTEFVAKLTAQGIFAKEVPSSNIAYHSQYIANAGPALLKYLNEVIQEPKARSKKWVSTSVPEDKWDAECAKCSSAEYHTNNLLNPVLFEETAMMIPADALVVEIAPHGLLQAILKKSLPECMHVPLTRRGNTDPVKFLFEAFGKLYQAGVDLKLDILYPKIEYPVSSGTPFLSQHVAWEHGEIWSNGYYANKEHRKTMIRNFVMSLHDDDYSFMKGHVRGGNYVFPEAAHLQLVWQSLAMYREVNFRELSVIFTDVHFHAEVIIMKDEPLRLEIMINKGDSRFEVIYNDTAIVTGFINELNAAANHRHECHHHEEDEQDDSENVTLTTKDIYTIMRLKGYSYEGEFQSIHSTNAAKTKANIRWNNNWIPFLDATIQFNAFAKTNDKVLIPSFFKKLVIDVDKHNDAKSSLSDDFTCISANLNALFEHTTCGGVKIEGLVLKEPLLPEHTQNVLLSQQFVPHFVTGLVGLKTTLQVNLQLIAENIIDKEIKVMDLLSKEYYSLKNLIKELSGEVPYSKFAFKSQDDENVSIEESDLIVADKLLGDDEKMKKIYEAISHGTFVLACEQITTNINPKFQLFNVITAMSVQKQNFILMRKINNCAEENVSCVPITQDQNFSWISKMQAELSKSQNIVLVSDRHPHSGLLGMVKKLRNEHGNKIRLVFIDDDHVPAFSPENNIFKDQLQKSLALNVLKKGQWGGYYYIPANNNDITPRNLQLATTKPCDIESLTWVEKPLIQPSNLRVQVCCAGPSFKDAQNAASRSHTNDLYGMDFSGITKSGEKVMGIIPKGAIASTVEADPDLLWPVPEHWSLEDAATVPLPYILAYYCLLRNNFFMDNNHVFIHGGAGALGQAFISIFLSRGFTVHTTVSDQGKKAFLLKLFPNLEEKNVVASVDNYYQDTILHNTNGGCSIIINFASGANRQAALKLCVFESLFVDLSDQEMLENENFHMGILRKAIHYTSKKLDMIFEPEFVKDKKRLQLQLSEGIAKGEVRPLSRVVYSPADVSRAFRLLCSSRHIGKVLIKMNDATFGKQLKVAARITYSSTSSYIVVCDDNTVLGMELADTLIKRGVRKLVLNLKPNELAGYCYTKFLTWKNLNVTVKLSTQDLRTEKGCKNLLEDATKLAPILGMFIVQNFSGAESLESEDVAAKFNKTAGVVANLDLTSRKICNELNHFVVLNYSVETSPEASDEYMVSVIESICEARNNIGLPALSFRTGLVKELGEENPERSRSALTSVLSDVETSLRLKYNVVLSVPLEKNVDAKFLQKLSNLIGVEDVTKMDENLTLEHVLLRDSTIAEVRTLINEHYNLSFSIENTRNITIASLINLEHTREEKKAKIVKTGLDAFFSHIDADEWKAAEPIMTMATTYSAYSVKEEDELDYSATYVMLLPGLEGHHEVFSELCERLHAPAAALQYGPEYAEASTQEMAAAMLKQIRKRFELKSKFYLLGYSFGVNVALELARLLEEEGHVGVVFCLDGSPLAMRAALAAHVGHERDSLQARLAARLSTLMRGETPPTLLPALLAARDWPQRVKICLDNLRGHTNFSNQYKRCIIEGAYNRITLAEQYEPDFKLRSELVLIKGTPHPDMAELPNDYGLSKYTTKPVQVFEIDADHAAIPFNCKVTSIVNRLLDPKLKEAFESVNLCATYLVNPVKGW